MSSSSGFLLEMRKDLGIKRYNGKIDTLAFGDSDYDFFYFNGNYYKFDWEIFDLIIKYLPYDQRIILNYTYYYYRNKIE